MDKKIKIANIIAAALLVVSPIVEIGSNGISTDVALAAKKKTKRSKKVKKAKKSFKKSKKKTKKAKKSWTYAKLYKKLYGSGILDYYNDEAATKIRNYRKVIIKAVQKYIKLNGSLTPKHEKYKLYLKANKNSRNYDINIGEDYTDGEDYIDKENSQVVKKGTKLGGFSYDPYYEDDQDYTFFDAAYYTDYTDPDNPVDRCCYVCDGAVVPIKDFSIVVEKSSKK